MAKDLLQSALDRALGTSSKTKTVKAKSKRKPITRDLLIILGARSGNKCETCKEELKGKLTPKANIHHKNGNPADNRESNLILLCPNCHSKADGKNVAKAAKKTTKVVAKNKKPKAKNDPLANTMAAFGI